MKPSMDLSETKLNNKEQSALKTFCSALTQTQNLGTLSIILYGSAAREDYRPGKSDINVLIVVDHINVAALKTTLKPVSNGRRHRIAPLFMTGENLRSSADVFPVKFAAMRDAYQVLHGDDVLEDLEISREHLRLRCEQEIKNLLLRLRRHFIMGGGRKLREMMSAVIVGFLENLRVA